MASKRRLRRQEERRRHERREEPLDETDSRVRTYAEIVELRVEQPEEVG